MSPAAALKVADAAGVEVGVDGDDLVLEASAPPPAAVLDLLARHKPGILALLREGEDGWSGEEWVAFFEERGGIAEFDWGRSRADADAFAFECCVVKWLDRHPAPSPLGRCASCGGAEMPGAVILPFGTEPNHHTWLHSDCWLVWRNSREADAVAALAAIGVRKPGSCQ